MCSETVQVPEGVVTNAITKFALHVTKNFLFSQVTFARSELKKWLVQQIQSYSEIVQDAIKSGSKTFEDFVEKHFDELLDKMGFVQIPGGDDDVEPSYQWTKP
jgi:hypothetical protein